MRTLADMTEKERAQCRGMWCVYKTPVGEERAIYEKTQSGAPVSMLFEPGYGRFEAENENITPRPDLPRAWAADGTPPAGEWEHAHIPGLGESTRRWISSWEKSH